MNRGSAHVECDVLVIGSGMSGCCAAIQAGRLGCGVILVEKDEVLGGNAGPNLGVGITGADRYSPYATETGVVHELHEEAGWIRALTQSSPGSMGYNIARRFEALLQERLLGAGVTVLKRHIALEPVLGDDGRITAVSCLDTGTIRPVEIAVRGLVIEASGDGEIGARAGADFDMGSESRDEFGERSAPEQRTGEVQGTSLVAIAHRVDHEVPFVPPAGLPPFQPRIWNSRIGSFLRHHEGWFRPEKDLVFLYVTETGGQRDTLCDEHEIYETLLAQLWAEWDHIKNGPHREEAACWDLLWVSPKAGKRESRRFLGDVVLTQADLECGRFFPDDLAWGGHDLDDHRPFRDGSNIVAHSVPPLYGIPLRACYSRNVPNLLLGGRLISATHIAHASTRVMRTGGAIGQGIGCAAAVALRHGCTPRQVVEDHLPELRRLLFETDASVVGRRPDMPDDVAPLAAVEASSECRFNDQMPGDFVPLLAAAGCLLWDWPETFEGAEVCLRNPTSEAIPLRLRVVRSRDGGRKWHTMEEYHRFGRNDLRDEAFAELAVIEALVPAGHEGWFAFVPSGPTALGRKDCTRDDDRLLVTLDEDPRLEWALAQGRCEIAAMVEHSHQGPFWSLLPARPTLKLTPPPRLGEAANILNGFKQRFSRGPLNMWISDPGLEFPQDVVLTWDEAVTLRGVEVIFDNIGEKRERYPWEEGPRALPILVRSYEVALRDGDDWRVVVRETDNFHRFRRHVFDRSGVAQALRLRIFETHGASSARVVEIRALRA